MSCLAKMARRKTAGLIVVLASASIPLHAFADSASSDIFKPEERAHWAFQPVVRPDVPRTKTRLDNPIDAFVSTALEAKGIKSSPPADKTTLLRRAYLDLIGLPPTPDEVDAFLADSSPKAFEKVVDRLLASPHYGERQARHWLDLARYAESEGFKADETRPNAWRYRDYVIKCFNDDKPYDRFVREQIAGDELYPNDPDALVATGFNRHYPDESNARNLQQRRQEILNDITDTVGAVFCGLTYACARCHNHKFDPILQSDYYRLQAFFANAAARDDAVLVPADEVKRYHDKLSVWEEKTRDIREQMEATARSKRKALEKEYFDKYPPEIQAMLRKPADERTPFERQMVWKAMQYLDPNSREYVGNTEAMMGKLKGEEKQRWQELTAELEKFSELKPPDLPLASAMVDIGCEAPPTFVLGRGFYDKPKEEVQPGFLQILNPAPAKISARSGRTSTGRRSALADILTDSKNPLTARVIVNRLWQSHFGKGIVGTPGDFGTQGERPTNPALLDWLASEFVRNGWSMKKLHRLIMTSRTYQQASEFREAAVKVDPDNKLLWRFPRQRLEGEIIRDCALAVSGLLNSKMGGPSIFPELPPGMPTPRGGWSVNKDIEERNRRSVYVFVRRNTRYPMFDAFDMPDPHESCPRRHVTTSPVQALTLLNSELTLTWAQNFAGRVIEAAGNDADRQIKTAFRFAYGREPDRTELDIGRNFFKREAEIVEARIAKKEQLALPLKCSSEVDPVQGAALVDFCHMLLNANEFVYRN